jgi:hypothetical protein
MELGGLSFLDRPVFGLSDGELFTRMRSITELERFLAAARLETACEVTGRGLHTKRGFTRPGMWLEHELKVVTAAASAMARLTTALRDLPDVASALAKGQISEDQAAVIVKAIAAIKKDASLDEQRAAVQRLIEQSSFCTPDVLETAGKQVFKHIAPDKAEERERKRVHDNERDAYDTRFLTLTNDSSGRVKVKGWLTQEAAAIFRSVLDPLCNPARHRNTALPGETTLPGIGAPPNAGPAAGTGILSGTVGQPDPANPFGRPADWQHRTSTDRGTGADNGNTAGSRPAVGNAFRDHRTPGQRRHDALMEMCQFLLAAGDLPETAAANHSSPSPSPTTSSTRNSQPARSTPANTSPPKQCAA